MTLCILTPMYGVTLDEAVALSLGFHPAIKSKISDHEAAVSDLDSAKWMRWPSVSMQTQTLDQKSVYDNQAGATVSLDQPLYTGGKITSTIDGADAKQEGAHSGIAEARNDVKIKVIDAYAGSIKFYQKIAYSKKNVAEHERLYQSILNRLEGGISSEADVALAKGRLNQARSELMQLELAYKNALSSLSLTIGQSVNEVVDFHEDLRFANLEEALEEARTNSPSLQRLQSEIKVVESEMGIKKSVLYPQISLKYDSYFGLAREMNYDTSRFMLTAGFQPGAGLSSMSNLESAQKKVLSALNNYETTKLDLYVRITTQYNETLSYLSQLKDAQEYAQQSDKVAQSYDRQYVIGKKSWIDLLNSKREATQAQYNYVDMRVGASAAIKKLTILTSKGL